MKHTVSPTLACIARGTRVGNNSRNVGLHSANEDSKLVFQTRITFVYRVWETLTYTHHPPPDPVLLQGDIRVTSSLAFTRSFFGSMGALLFVLPSHARHDSLAFPDTIVIERWDCQQPCMVSRRTVPSGRTKPRWCYGDTTGLVPTICDMWGDQSSQPIMSSEGNREALTIDEHRYAKFVRLHLPKTNKHGSGVHLTNSEL